MLHAYTDYSFKLLNAFRCCLFQKCLLRCDHFLCKCSTFQLSCLVTCVNVCDLIDKLSIESLLPLVISNFLKATYAAMYRCVHECCCVYLSQINLMLAAFFNTCLAMAGISSTVARIWVVPYLRLYDLGLYIQHDSAGAGNSCTQRVQAFALV